MKYFLSAAFVASVAFMPWWVALPLAIVLLAEWQAAFVVISGGIMRDLLFGVPQPALWGFSMIYTAVFGFLALLSWYLHIHVLER